jgi:hypothetical protein
MQTIRNPFLLQSLKFPTTDFSDFKEWDNRMDPNIFEDVEKFNTEAVS